MPIRPENKARYPKDWKAISLRIRERAGNKCEQCGAANGSTVDRNGKLVVIVLTVAHLDHTPENCADDNLRAWCQKCHNSYDMPERRRGIAERSKAAKALGDLFS
jgi:5-methylcytosine-specific restriction endonuclease McrA